MGSEEDKKLTKKQLKAQQFRKSKEEKSQENEIKPEQVQDGKRPSSEAGKDGEEPVKKKRKTRRGRGGKGKNGKKGNRFIVFVGSLPRDITAAELQSHFKNSSPDQIRLRADKGIAFLEFDADKDRTGIQRRMDIALLQHGTLLKEKKINVELTVGGGGNSQDRLEKLKNKNIKLDEERKERLTKMITDGNQKKIAKTTAAAAAATTPMATTGSEKPVPAGIHPDRARLLK
ncbi:nop6p [Saccharomyces arboricola H-6]|uniref:Nop6p n=1 Tax=Saccharomyces arboricola (strain H-6 / AS 2.3317 / CBS 10644) TaxID=1160507 RepID=J8LQP4_SACAR|nr:nop6p [Saccharomyces arboricola H-6]